MKIKKILSLVLCVGAILAMSFLLYRNQAKIVEADASDNVSGFAWSDLIGWISFNCNNPELAAPRCVSSDYGVNIDDNGVTGLFKGYAWSSNVGWIDFNPADLASCPAVFPETCQRATVDKKTGRVTGWVKFLTTGDWIRLDDVSWTTHMSISKASGSEGDFSGYAWGGTTSGWISFSCENKAICSPVNYKVKTTFDMNIRPTVVVGLAPNPNAVNLCTFPAYNFSWNFNDEDDGSDGNLPDTQRWYQIQIATTTSNWNSAGWTAGVGEVDIIATSSAQSSEIKVVKNPGADQLAYKTDYKWRIKVWDNHPTSVNSESAWVAGVPFTTKEHIYPTAKFDWKPKPIIQDQLIQFCSVASGPCATNISECYDINNNIISCAAASFTWTIPILDAEFASSTTATSENPVIKFKKSGVQSVTLQIQDNVGACSTSTNPRVTAPLPRQREISP